MPLQEEPHDAGVNAIEFYNFTIMQFLCHSMPSLYTSATVQMLKFQYADFHGRDSKISAIDLMENHSRQPKSRKNPR